jgi:hypothetical protein
MGRMMTPLFEFYHAVKSIPDGWIMVSPKYGKSGREYIVILTIRKV